MKISFKPANKPNLCLIFLDGAPWKEYHRTIFGRNPPFPSHCESMEAFTSIFSEMEYRFARNYAIRRLSLQGMLSITLSTLLKERLVSKINIEKVIEELTNSGFLNDKEWSSSFVRNQSLKKVGPRLVAQKLLQKGVKDNELKEALVTLSDPNKQKEAILLLLKKKYARRDLADFKEKQKVIASLSRRGFDLSVVLSCFSIVE